MPIDLATTIVASFLVPYAKAGLEKIAQSATKEFSSKVGEYASELTEKVWQRVKTAFSSDDDQKLLEWFEKKPEGMRAMIIETLEEKLKQDEQLAQQLSELVNKPAPEGSSTGAQIMNATIAGIADLRGADLSHAQGLRIAGVIYGSSVPDQPKSPAIDSEI